MVQINDSHISIKLNISSNWWSLKVFIYLGPGLIHPNEEWVIYFGPFINQTAFESTRLDPKLFGSDLLPCGCNLVYGDWTQEYLSCQLRHHSTLSNDDWDNI